MRERIASYNSEAIVYEPQELDKAIIGISHNGTLVYSYVKLVKVFMKINKSWSEEDAVEWVDYNIIGGYLGEYTPIIVFTI